MKKQELIDEILPLLKLGTPQERTKMRADLESHTLTELTAYFGVVSGPAYQLEADETALDEMKAARNRELQLLRIFKFSGLKSTPENEALLDKLLGTAISPETFRSLIEKNPQYQNRFEWESAPFGAIRQAEADQSKQRTKIRQAFSAAAKAVTAQGLHDVGDFAANFNLVCGVLGTQFSVADVVRVLTDGSIQGLAPSGNAAELRATHQQKQIENHNLALINADTQTLRKVARQEAANRQTEAEKQVVLDMQAQRRRDAAMDFPSLPGTWQGQKLDAAFIRRCDVPTQKLLAKRFGSAQLDARLQVVAKGDSK